MNEATKKSLWADLLGCLAVVVAIAAITAIIHWMNASNSPSVPNSPTVLNVRPEPNKPPVVVEQVVLLCKNPLCGHRFEMSREEFLAKSPPEGTPVFKCPKCGQESAYAEKETPNKNGQ